MHNHYKRPAEGLFYKKFAIVVGIGTVFIVASQIIILGRSSKYRTVQTLSPDVSPECSLDGDADAIECNLPSVKNNRGGKSSIFSPTKNPLFNQEYVVLMLTTSTDKYSLTRAIDRLLNVARGKFVEIVISIPENAPRSVTTALYEYPVRIIKVPARKEKSDFMEYNHNLGDTLKEKIAKGYQIFKNLLSRGAEKCPTIAERDFINVMHNYINGSDNFQYKFPHNDVGGQKNVTFGNSKYNPNMQKYNLVKYGNSPENYKTNFDLHKKACDSVHYVKTSLKLVIQAFPGLRNIIIVDDQKNYSPQLIEFFQHTSRIFELDPSIFCVSADYPLIPEDSDAPVSNLTRVDHFIGGGATLIPLKIAQEIIQSYEEPFSGEDNERLPPLDHIDPLEDLVKWFSFPRRRKGRGCVVPYKPRVCPLTENCDVPSTKFPMEKLVRYIYSIDLLPHLDGAEDVKRNQLPCYTDEPLKQKNASKVLTVYVKMDSHDDDLTMYHVMKCFGINHQRMIGNFDGVYSFFWGKIPIYVLGVPYSRFGPTIIKGAELLMILLRPLSATSITEINKYEDYLQVTTLNISTVPYTMADDEKKS